MDRELEGLKRLKETKGNAAAVFSLKGKIVGKKKDPDEPSVVMDPKTKKLSFKPSEIVKISADYCQDLLTNREPRKGYEDDLEWKLRVHEVRMKENVPDDVEFSWRDTTTLQLPKGRGRKEDLSNRRHIHTKTEIPKFFQHMVTTAAKPMIVENMPANQIGAVPGHRAEEHLFTIKSFIALKEKENKAVAITQLDLVKYFDSESLIDTLNELYKGKVKGKLYKLMYEMNRNNRIKVRTPVGDSDTRETNENVYRAQLRARF